MVPYSGPWIDTGESRLVNLSGEAVSLIIRSRMAAAGFATSAARAGVSTFKIRQQTGHASDAMLSRYVRDGELSSGTLRVFFSRRWNGIWRLPCAIWAKIRVPKMEVPMPSSQSISRRTGTSPKGGERAYSGCLGNGRNASQSRHSVTSAK